MQEYAAQVKPETDPFVFRILIGTALLVIFVRLFTPFWGQWDLNVQINAAQRLLEGQGLTVDYELDQLNINQETSVTPLTHFPPGFSIILAALLYTGLSLPTSLKIIFSCAMFCGWLGWARLAAPVLSRPLFGCGTRLFPRFFAFLLPLYFTSFWEGTDLFLWAGTPWVYRWLLQSDALDRKGMLSALSAGMLFGLLYSIRYASAFLALLAMVLLPVRNTPRWKNWILLSLLFLAGSCLFILPTMLYTRHVASAALPLYFSLDSAAGALERIGRSLFFTLHVWNIPFGDKIIFFLRQNPFWVWTVGFLHIPLLVAIGVYGYRLSQREKVETRFSPTLAVIPGTLIAFLALSMFGNVFVYLGEQRYYFPANLALLLTVWSIASSPESRRTVRALSSVFLVLLSLSIFLFLPILTTRNVARAGNRFLYLPVHCLFEANEFRTDLDDLVHRIEALHREEPEALFLADWPHEMITRADMSYLKSIPLGTFFREREPFYFADRPTVVYWVVNDVYNPVTREVEALPESRLIDENDGSLNPTVPFVDWLVHRSALRPYYRLTGSSLIHFHIYRTFLPAGYTFRKTKT